MLKRPLPVVLVILTCLSSCIESTTGCKDPSASNYDALATFSDYCLCRYDGFYPSCGQQVPSSLSIAPIQQETEVWCWLAVGEMIFRYYGLPNVNQAGDYQCGIVGALGYSLNGACDACNQNCGNCIRPAGEPSMLTYMLEQYPRVACRDLYESGQTLENTFVSNFLSEQFLISELDAGRPVIAGINPGQQFVLPGNSQHVALITGYSYFSGNLFLEVNDPYPYWYQGVDPYSQNGAVNNGDLSYQISHSSLVNGLLWNTSWYGIGW